MKEIEKKYLVKAFPFSLDGYKKIEIEQGYISINPDIRVRKADDKLTYTFKGDGDLEREEKEELLPRDAYDFFIEQAYKLGNVIHKTRYLIPIQHGLVAEFDVYHDDLEGLKVVEVEFDDKIYASIFQKPCWFGEEVTYNVDYKNKNILNSFRNECMVRVRTDKALNDN